MNSAGSTVRFSLTVRDASTALDFYTQAFGAKELFRMSAPDGSVAHAEFQIGNTAIFISGEHPDWKAHAMPEGTLASCLLCVEVPDCDAAYQKAITAGATAISQPTDEFWGMRSAVVADPDGYRWSFGQVLEVLTNEEISARAEKIFGGSA